MDTEDKEKTGLEKFNTCQFRSAGLEKLGNKWCCGDSFHDGFLCWERNIEDVSPSDCEGCDRYLEKINIEELKECN